MDMLTEISNHLRSNVPSKKLITRATRHLNPNNKKFLFSENPHHKCIALGRLFEAIIYEQIVELSNRTNRIKWVIRKGDDISTTLRKNKREGFSYDKKGDIIINGCGKELGEMDIVLMDNKNQLSFIEINTSIQNLGDFDKEVAYKKKLIGMLSSKTEVPFLFITSADVRNHKAIQNLLGMSQTQYSQIGWFDKISSRLFNSQVKQYRGTESIAKKAITIGQIEGLEDIDFYAMHDECREKIMNTAKTNGSIEELEKDIGELPIIDRIVLGKLDKEATDYLYRKFDIVVDNPIPSKICWQRFTEVIVGIRLPALRPVLYLKVKKKYLKKKMEQSYLKLGPQTITSFHYERNIPMRANYFTVLAKEKNVIGKEELTKFLNYYIREEVARPHSRYRAPNVVLLSDL